MAQSNVDPFPAAALETNRSGSLTDSQRGRLRGLAREGRKDELLLSVVSGVVGVLLLAPVGPAPNAWARPLAGAAFLAVSFLLLRVAIKGDSMTQDMRSGRVQAIEGAIGKHTYDREGEHSRSTAYYLDLAGQSFEVDSTAYHAAPDVGYVRLYVLPRSHALVNLERLPDRPLPAGTTTSPMEFVKVAATAVFSADRTRSSEARAEMAAMEKAMQVEHAASATPPPADQRDPRPLAQAILGTWQTGPISMSFLPDGTMVATLPGGHEQQGRWSVGSDGRLHANATGGDQALDAWVAGDMLTISENGEALAYRRVAAR